MADSENLARELSALSPQELADVLTSARELRYADGIKAITDYADQQRFNACPFCGIRSDSTNIDYKIFLAIVEDAFVHGAESVFLLALMRALASRLTTRRMTRLR